MADTKTDNKKEVKKKVDLLNMDAVKRSYLMIGGTLLPAFAGVHIASMITKKPFSTKDSNMLLLFAGLSVLGGYATSRLLKTYTNTTVNIKVDVKEGDSIDEYPNDNFEQDV